MSEEQKLRIFKVSDRLFDLGMIVATQAAIAATTDKQRIDMLLWHATGEWGCVCEEDREANNEALKSGSRLLSAYPIDPALPSKGWGENTLWIITESDRSATTLLLPDEY